MEDATWQARLTPVEGLLLQHQHMIEELRARTQDCQEQMEERMAKVEESLARAVGSLMPKVEELLAKYQNSASSAAISDALPPTTRELVAPVAAYPDAPSTTATSLASGHEPEYQPQPPLSEEEMQLPNPSPSSTAPTAFPRWRLLVQPLAFFFCLLLAVIAARDLLGSASPLCESHSDVNSQASTVLPSSVHEAAAQGDVAEMQKMLATGERVDARDANGNTPLHLAASYGCVGAVDFLISKGAMVHSCGERARTPIMCAVSAGHSETVAHLVAARSNLDLQDAEGATALAIAAKVGHKRVVKFLLGKGASVEKADENGETPLHHAVKGGHLDIVTLLLQSGASRWTRNKENETPLHVAARMGFGSILAEMFKLFELVRKQEIQECLSDMGSAEVVWVMADTMRSMVLGEDGENALRTAAKNGRVEVLEALLQVGVNPNAPSGGGWTALHYAAEKGHALCIQTLLRAGADPNLMASIIWARNTPLHVAAKEGHANCVRELLQGGADSDLLNWNEKTALQLAWNTECMRLLQKTDPLTHKRDRERL